MRRAWMGGGGVGVGQIQNLYSCSTSAYHNPKLNPDLKLIELVLHWLWVPIYNSAVRKMRVSD